MNVLPVFMIDGQLMMKEDLTK